MTTLYLVFGCFALLWLALWLASRHGADIQKTVTLEKELQNAKEAKDVRAGKPLDDKWLRPRD